MRNIITSLTAIAFILMTLTIVLFITKINDQLIHIHHITAHIFWAIIILHLVMKAKRFVSLLKKHS